MSNLMVVIPTYNEAENLPVMVNALFGLGIDGLRILIVDDNSPDGTGKIADELVAEFPEQVNVLHRPGKGGLGPAYIAGFKKAISLGAELILQMDCDFSHQPKYIPNMLEMMKPGVDIVLGSRFVKGGSVDPSWGIYRTLLSKWANRIYVPTILGLPVNDATGGFRLWRKDTLIGMGLDRIKSNGYVFQVELAYVAHKLGFNAVETPIHFPDRQVGISKMHAGIAREAARRVFAIRATHHNLTPQMRNTMPYGEY